MRTNPWNFSGRPRHYMRVEADVALLQRARKGDEAAFSELFARHRLPIFRYAMYMGGRDLADDVVQETFLVVLQQSGRSDTPRGEVLAYLLGIARHLVLKHLRLRTDVVSDDRLDVLPSADLNPLDELDRAERISSVREAIHTLPATYREAIILCDLQELEYASAAAVMQCPVGTVRSRLARARALVLRKVAEGPRWVKDQPGTR